MAEQWIPIKGLVEKRGMGVDGYHDKDGSLVGRNRRNSTIFIVHIFTICFQDSTGFDGNHKLVHRTE